MKKNLLFILLVSLCLVLQAQQGIENLSSGTSGDAILTIESDTDNNNEGDNSRIVLLQDGGLLGAYIGFNNDWGGGSNNAGSQSDNLFRIGTRYSNLDYFNRFVINTYSGNVGVGLDNPEAKFSIKSSGTIGPNGDYSKSSIYLTDGSQKMGIDPNQIFTEHDINIDAYTFIKFNTNRTTRMQISQVGNVGIGITPTAKLSVQSTGTIGPNGDYSKSSIYLTDGSQKMGIDPNQIYADQDINIDASTFIKFNTDRITRMQVFQNGNVGIGTTSTGSHKLAVGGSIGAREIKVEAGTWSDFVFENDYELRTLEEVEEHIKKNGHLPEIPSQAEVTENGVNLGEMDAKLLQKIEELTLYLIEQNKELKNAQTEILELKEKVNRLENE